MDPAPCIHIPISKGPQRTLVMQFLLHLDLLGKVDKARK